ncbi:hypothetical protein [Clostridium sp. DMHC 10]|uniref:hypothetical protein n=2 Tax=Clostridium TaxID=1485 RepID=UPI0018DCC9B4|nr:hypothetical protein [Clostridium sp. DMHC 10]
MSFILLGMSIFLYYLDYSIKDNDLLMQKYLVGKGVIGDNLKVKKQLYLQNYKIVLFNYSDSKTTYAVLKRGLNNRYKYLNSGMCYGNICRFKHKIGKQTYYICVGYNSNNKYLQISTNSYFKNDISNYKIKNHNYFILYKLIDPHKFYYFRYSDI